MTMRRIRRVTRSMPTIEGAGVHLRRAFGSAEVPDLDPFLLLDDFRSDEPRYYLKGFPWHPHRGIETITYVLQGKVEHGDSMGNTGVIGAGDVQWMTAGSGIIHQEMPKGDPKGSMGGFQLWANLPASHKMMEPRYRGLIKEEIPSVAFDGGAVVRVICGLFQGIEGPVQDIVTDPEYLDVSLPPFGDFVHPTKVGHTVLAYVIGGGWRMQEETDRAGLKAEGSPHTKNPLIDDQSLVIFEDGEEIRVSAGKEGARFLLVSGRPIGEPVAWYGPIVMNTQEELRVAFDEYASGTFIKHKGRGA